MLDFKMSGRELLKEESLVLLNMVSIEEKKGKKEKKLREKGTGKRENVKAF